VLYHWNLHGLHGRMLRTCRNHNGLLVVRGGSAGSGMPMAWYDNNGVSMVSTAGSTATPKP
jgi:hypothetical protein